MLNAVVATITLARDANEERLIVDALGVLAGIGMPVVVVDGGSPIGFVELLRALPRVQVFEASERGLVAQVKAAIAAAAALGAPWILYTEPDKMSFFAERLPAFLDSAGALRGAAVILASRSEKGFATFPPVQQLTESTFNRLAGHVLGLHADCLYGPFLFRSTLAAELTHVGRDLGWGWRPFLFTRVILQGLGVSSVVADFLCPDQQRSEGEGDRVHRIQQLHQNLSGLLQALAVAAVDRPSLP